MSAIASTEHRGYGFSYRLPQCVAMSLQADRRANFEAWMKAAGLNMNQIAEATGVQYNTIRSYLVEIKGKRTGSLSGENESKIAGAYNLAVEDIFGPAPGSEAQPNHLRAWREFKQMTVDELAQKLDVSASTVSLWEGQPVAPSDKWIRRVGAALEIPTGFIAEYDPNELDSAALEQALSVLKGKASIKAAPAKPKKSAAA